ncbi:hypothetical protein KIN20_034042 [Parelaphostrongylus tenuis]|uniref:Uncharacterized protein n=1 Tax=Parelaphostrongylus tenuis TaxID=148309 RepID=A0AAD5WJE8_PARTN|nr:hypothetical protein KIN20_034042 [Parelaphostrongylus tenuis]
MMKVARDRVIWRDVGRKPHLVHHVGDDGPRSQEPHELRSICTGVLAEWMCSGCCGDEAGVRISCRVRKKAKMLNMLPAYEKK